MPSETYRLFARSMAERKQILCLYDGYPRELCAVLLGHSKGEEVALAYQFGGTGKTPLPAKGQWKCLYLSKVSAVKLREGPWRAGKSHKRAQACVDDVDLDVNPESPYAPRRHLRIVR